VSTVFQKYEPGKILPGYKYEEGKSVPYAKVSRLESPQEEFAMVAVSILRELP